MSVDFLATTIADQTYDRVRADILFGRLAPGAKLRLERMAATYGASVSTLREIFGRLSSEKLLVAEGQRGFQVAPVSPDGFRDVAAMRLLLEEHAIPLSFAAGDLEWESRVVAAHHKLAALERQMMAGKQADAVAWKRYDREFHQALIAACGSQTLLDLYAGVFDHYLRYQMVAVVFRGAIAAKEHRQLLEAALSRDAGRACAALSAHVNGCVDYTIGSGLLT